MLLDRIQRLLPGRTVFPPDFRLRGGTRFCAQLVEVEGRDVLDVGSSIGWFARDAVARGARSVTAVDASAEALAVARAKVPEATFVLGDALALPFGEASFDVVTMFNVIEHLPRGTEAALLAEGARVLRPGGTLALVTPHAHPVPTLADPAWYLGHRHYRAARMRALFAAAGLRVQRLVVAGGLADTADLLLFYVWRHLARRETHPFKAIASRADREFDGSRGRNHLAVVATRDYDS